MPITFNADEIFSMAEQIERNGARFYRTCAQNNPTHKDLLLNLAQMEEQHEKTFKALHAEIAGRETEPTAADPDQETAQYLEVLAGGYVFDVKKDPSETLRGNESFQEILRIAIGLEKDSIVFYVGMKEMIRKASGREKLDWIIKEEMKHITMLSTRLAEVE